MIALAAPRSHWSLYALEASPPVAGKFAPILDRMEVYKLVRRSVGGKEFKGVARLATELKGSGYILPSRETLRRWVLRQTSPFSGKRVFEARPSEELSFFLGAWIGDGWSDDSDGGKRMLLKVRSHDFAREFADCATKILSKTKPYKVRAVLDEGKTWYIVKVTSFMLYEFVNQSMEQLLTYLEAFPHAFLRGLFTAEGGPSVSVQHSRRLYLDVGLFASNSDYQLLALSASMLSKLGLLPGRIKLDTEKGEKTNYGVARKSTWQLLLSKFRDVEEFALAIGFADSRKQQKLADAISFIKEQGRTGGAIKWMSFYEKRRGDWVRKSGFTVS